MMLEASRIPKEPATGSQRTRTVAVNEPGAEKQPAWGLSLVLILVLFVAVAVNSATCREARLLAPPRKRLGKPSLE